jgi:hypothetical protein
MDNKINMKRIQVYGFEASTGKYEGLEYAYEDPLDPGNYMMPANSTTQPPPSTNSDKEFSVWDGSRWTVTKIEKPDEPEEIKPTQEQIWEMFRSERNYRISRTDYLFLEDAPPMTPEKKQLWKEYRQALRDLPSHTSDPENPVWPTPPE